MIYIAQNCLQRGKMISLTIVVNSKVFSHVAHKRAARQSNNYSTSSGLESTIYFLGWNDRKMFATRHHKADIFLNWSSHLLINAGKSACLNKATHKNNRFPLPSYPAMPEIAHETSLIPKRLFYGGRIFYRNKTVFF